MSEFAPKFEQHEALSSPEHTEKLLPDAEHAEALRPGEKDPVQALNEARTTLAEVAPASQENVAQRLQVAESAPQDAPQTINTELRDVTLRRELRSLQRREPAVRRALSKTIHQPAVRAVSTAAGASVSRPSGILGGGLTAFLGTSAYLLFAKHYGFQYRASVFLALFVAGFALGLVLELFIHFASSSRHKALDA